MPQRNSKLRMSKNIRINITNREQKTPVLWYVGASVNNTKKEKRNNGGKGCARGVREERLRN